MKRFGFLLVLILAACTSTPATPYRPDDKPRVPINVLVNLRSPGGP